MKKSVFLIITILAIIILCCFVVMKVFLPIVSVPTINLPAPSDSSSQADGDKLDRVVVTADTVQTAVSTLSRAENYSQTYTVTNHYSGGEMETQLQHWKMGNSVRFRTEQNSTARNLLIVDGIVYIWYEDSDDVFTASLADYNPTLLDKHARILTYEELLDLPRECILDAGYTDEAGERCIMAEYESGNYVNRILISVDSGCLISATISDGETLIYSMETQAIELSTSKDIFAPPSTKTTLPQQ